MLLTLPNPKHNEIINRYNHLDGIQMHDNDTKNLLPIHIILGTSDFAKIKMGTDWWTICGASKNGLGYNVTWQKKWYRVQSVPVH